MFQKLKRYFPLLFNICLMLLVYFTGLYHYLSYESLKSYHTEIQQFVAANPVLAPVIYVSIYITATMLSIPGGIFLSLLGGYTFAMPWSFLYVLIGATIGSTLLFLCARSAFGEKLFQKAGPMLQKMESGFKENAISYLLFLRLVPIFPFWLVNLAPALFNVRLYTFVWTTFIGIAPGSFVFTQAGSGLGAIFESDQGISLDTIFNTEIKIALVALGFFALIPVIIKKIREKNA